MLHFSNISISLFPSGALTGALQGCLKQTNPSLGPVPPARGLDRGPAPVPSPSPAPGPAPSHGQGSAD